MVLFSSLKKMHKIEEKFRRFNQLSPEDDEDATEENEHSLRDDKLIGWMVRQYTHKYYYWELVMRSKFKVIFTVYLQYSVLEYECVHKQTVLVLYLHEYGVLIVLT